VTPILPADRHVNICALCAAGRHLSFAPVPNKRTQHGERISQLWWMSAWLSLKPSRLHTLLFDCRTGLERSREFELDSLSLIGRRSITCFAATHRYVGLNELSPVDLATTSYMPATAICFVQSLRDT